MSAKKNSHFCGSVLEGFFANQVKEITLRVIFRVVQFSDRYKPVFVCFHRFKQKTMLTTAGFKVCKQEILRSTTVNSQVTVVLAAKSFSPPKPIRLRGKCCERKRSKNRNQSPNRTSRSQTRCRQHIKGYPPASCCNQKVVARRQQIPAYPNWNGVNCAP